MAWPFPADDAVLASGKTGEVSTIFWKPWSTTSRPPRATARPPCALIFDSYFDAYRGVVALIRVVDGHIKKGDKIHDGHGHGDAREEVGARHPQEVPEEALYVGEVGYLVTGLKDVSQVKVGDTITVADGGVNEPLPGYREAKPMVFTGLFPIDGDQYEPLKEALEKLSLNDPASCVGARDPLMPSASASAWAFWAFCTWRSLASRLEREFGSTFWPRRLRWSTTCTSRAARWCLCTRPRRCPTPAPSITWKSPI